MLPHLRDITLSGSTSGGHYFGELSRHMQMWCSTVFEISTSCHPFTAVCQQKFRVMSYDGNRTRLSSPCCPSSRNTPAAWRGSRVSCSKSARALVPSSGPRSSKGCVCPVVAVVGARSGCSGLAGRGFWMPKDE